MSRRVKKGAPVNTQTEQTFKRYKKIHESKNILQCQIEKRFSQGWNGEQIEVDLWEEVRRYFVDCKYEQEYTKLQELYSVSDIKVSIGEVRTFRSKRDIMYVLSKFKTNVEPEVQTSSQQAISVRLLYLIIIYYFMFNQPQFRQNQILKPWSLRWLKEQQPEFISIMRNGRCRSPKNRANYNVIELLVRWSLEMLAILNVFAQF